MSRQRNRTASGPSDAPRTVSRDAESAERSAKAASTSADYLRRGLLAAAAALLVARPLVPSDGGPWVGDGQPFALLWILAALLWTLGALGQPRFQVRFGWIDRLLVAWVAWWSIAALIGARHGAPRPSLNMLWEAVGVGAAFFALRQLVQRPREWRALIAVMIALCVAEAGLAFQQYFVTLPAQRARFEKHPQAVFDDAGMVMPERDSPDFKHFADRLNSSEPIGSFALTNSLAALLAPWLVVAAGLALMGWRGAKSKGRSPDLAREATGRKNIWLWLPAAAVAILLAAALALTRSRSAWIGAVVGLAATALLAWRLRARADTSHTSAPAQRPRVALVALIVMAALLLIGAGAAVVRPALFEPALRSLRFRGEYWETTVRMIGDRPAWGCGPGNFKEYYTGYKLPAASEEVSDPHNFALEVAANAGLPALALLLALFTVFAWRTWRTVSLPLEESHREAEAARAESGSLRAEESGAPVRSDALWWILAGGLIGFWLALVWNLVFGFGSQDVQVIVCTWGAAIVLAALFPWIRGGVLPVGLIGVAVATQLVALLAVGGISSGGVAGTLWIMVAAGASATDRPGKQPISLPGWTGWVVVAALAALAYAQYQTSYEPFMTAQGRVVEARRQLDKRDIVETKRQFTLAADADRWMAEARRWLARIGLELWRVKDRFGMHNRDGLSDFEHWSEEAERVDPLSSEIWLEAARGWREIYSVDHSAAHGERAVAASRRAVELYPNSPLLQFELAETLEATGHAADAKAAAREALRLDGLTPHEDKKLSAEQRKSAERIGK